MRRLRQAAIAFLLASVAVGLWRARDWPLVNDAALMQYVVFLMRHGMAPYREIGDINFPGAYAVPWLSGVLAHLLHLSEAAMARITDALALLLAGLAMGRIAGPGRVLSAIWAGSLFALFHLRDGIGQAYQRDLWMAVLLLWAVALVRNPKHAALAGLLIGSAATIKPFASLWLLCLLWAPRRRVALLIFLVPPAASAFFLVHRHAFAGFWRVLTIDLPYHASLADGSVFQLLAKSTPPATKAILLIASGCFLALIKSQTGLHRLPRPSQETSLLSLSVILGLTSFVAQGKGYPYQRYPYIAFLLILAAFAFQTAANSIYKPARVLGAAGFAFGILACAPAYLSASNRAHWPLDAQAAMESVIRAQGTLDGEVQCIDAVSGCTDALLALHLRQATGTLYDEYLFPQTPAAWGAVYPGFPPGVALPRAVMLARERFRPTFEAHPPRVLIVSSWLFLEGPGDYRKLALWPWFQQYLQAHYTLKAEHSFARAENGPLGFRVYIRQ